ncbi:hypothetical protein P7C73_g3308, partial [Tremellales sp. Uapishka_1]
MSEHKRTYSGEQTVTVDEHDRRGSVATVISAVTSLVSDTTTDSEEGEDDRPPSMASWTYRPATLYLRAQEQSQQLTWIRRSIQEAYDKTSRASPRTLGIGAASSRLHDLLTVRLDDRDSTTDMKDFSVAARGNGSTDERLTADEAKELLLKHQNFFHLDDSVYEKYVREPGTVQQSHTVTR